MWSLDTLPPRLAILGGGPIGCEMAQAFRRLGSDVTQIELGSRLLSREDPEASTAIRDRFEREGIRVLTGYRAQRFESTDGVTRIECTPADESGGDALTVECDRVLVAVGRRAVTEPLGLERLGIELRPNGTIDTNEYLQTSMPNIYACGDVAGPWQLTHVAGHQGWYCAMNALFGSFWKFRADYSALPWAVFTDPELARVGLNEQEATEKRMPFEVTHYGVEDLDRAIADNTAEGFVKVLTPPGNDRILGVTIVGPHAGDLIAEFVLAVRHGLGLKKILGTIHTYPTLAKRTSSLPASGRKLTCRPARSSGRRACWVGCAAERKRSLLQTVANQAVRTMQTQSDEPILWSCTRIILIMPCAMRPTPSFRFVTCAARTRWATPSCRHCAA